MTLQNVLTVELPVGTVAAILTALEYILSTFSALSARAAMHGIWLFRLHRGRRASLNFNKRSNRAFRKDLLGFMLGVWLVVGVALVESNLHSGVRIANKTINSPLCVSVYGKYRPKRVQYLRPPYRTTVEPWILTVAQLIGCGDKGISTVGVGGITDRFGNKRNMLAPTCSKSAINVAEGNISSTITMMDIGRWGFQFELGISEAFLILPHGRGTIGKDMTRLGLQSEGTGICGQRGISSLFTSLPNSFETASAVAANVSFSVHEAVCYLHGIQSVDVLSNSVVESCTRQAPGHIAVDCLRSKADVRHLKRVRIRQVSVLLIANTTDGPSYACTSATVEQEYVFVPAPTIRRLIQDKQHHTADGEPKLPVLIPTKMQVVDGHCERTVAAIGHAALIYSADSEWSIDDLSTVERRTRYYAYVMAVSTSQFPLNEVREPESAKVNGSCMVRPVFEVTEIPTDWRFVLLSMALASAGAIMMVGVSFRLLFCGDSWKVGSAEWSLFQFQNTEEHASDHVVEVTQVGQTEDEMEDRQRGDEGTKSYITVDEAAAAEDGRGNQTGRGSRAGREIARGRYEYHMRRKEEM